MKNGKRFAAAALALLMLAGCGKKNDSSSSDNGSTANSTASVSQTQSSDSSSADSSESAEDSSADSESSSEESDSKDKKDPKDNKDKKDSKSDESAADESSKEEILDPDDDPDAHAVAVKFMECMRSGDKDGAYELCSDIFIACMNVSSYSWESHEDVKYSLEFDMVDNGEYIYKVVNADSSKSLRFAVKDSGSGFKVIDLESGAGSLLDMLGTKFADMAAELIYNVADYYKDQLSDGEYKNIDNPVIEQTLTSAQERADEKAPGIFKSENVRYLISVSGGNITVTVEYTLDGRAYKAVYPKD
ncbi:hypothetical protein SAMN02910447_00901 [Ruminococcus sp. YE71]|uniref:hypothetical protein n=1 Tax=unclassified Ruminococcus TaxID=2608920 RepID=UPI00088255E9|nr:MULTISPECIES: hypothetical protein [unclassified Ruminococcus]SDA15290.1 hypothetical protein SAMN02910446_00900 [Ruminococcus sp. YE78]SFW22303.1 hypothetical protein SAMN02910447_00901 [Ruminococcus sp. YE71]